MTVLGATGSLLPVLSRFLKHWLASSQWHRTFRAILLATIALPITSMATAGELRPLLVVDGAPMQAELVNLPAAGPWLVKDAAGAERDLPRDEIVSWGTPAESALGPLVFLADDGLLVQPPEPGQGPATVVFDKDRLHLDRSALGKLTLALEDVRGVIFHPPADRHQRDLLASRLFGDNAQPPAEGERRDCDRVVLENGDELDGTLESCDGRQVKIAVGAANMTIEVAKVEAIVFNPSLLAPRQKMETGTIVGLADGSRIVARRVELDGDTLRIVPRLADDDKSPWLASRAALVFLQPLAGRVTYLSDLDAESYKHLPYLSLAWPYHDDANVSGLPLRAGGRLYAKGIGMHSAARLTYRLDKPYQRFEAEVAIDDETLARGSVTVRVFVDSQQRWASEIIRGGMPPVPVSVDIAGGKQFSLIVDFAERADEQDHVDWLDARLIQ
ncbi:MAG TPA: NPCBM/NEW2 domain-containing protein [Pirellulales bacterium]|jgi:hypothetical protein|nr:NPCBM/NEW2 domain-containing protein [Pirellulales bacterium]